MQNCVCTDLNKNSSEVQPKSKFLHYLLQHHLHNTFKTGKCETNENDGEIEKVGDDYIFCCERHREMGIPTSWCLWQNQRGER